MLLVCLVTHLGLQNDLEMQSQAGWVGRRGVDLETLETKVSSSSTLCAD